MDITALIPARSGSKGVTKKNLKVINGKPLIQWTIEAAVGSGVFSRIVVSTNDKEVLELADRLNVRTLVRPDEFASDTAKSSDVLRHFLDENPEITNLAYLQPTSPLRTSAHISDAVNQFFQSKMDCLISVTEVTQYPEFMYSLSPRGLLIREQEMHEVRRQDMPVRFLANGAMYIAKTDILKNKNYNFARCNAYAFPMAAEESIDLDTPTDFLIAEQIMRINNL
jgi:CMP-N-acetylneuraminic acid synthetase